MTTPPTQALDEPRGFRDHISGFFQAVRHRLWYIVFGCIVGFVLVLLSIYVKAGLDLIGIFAPSAHIPEVAGKLVEHVGMGFIVAAVAVLFYEWTAHFKEFLRLSGELIELKQAVAAQALSGALRTYVRTGDTAHNDEVIKAITQIVEGLKKLEDHGDWTQRAFQRYITASILKVSRNAMELADLSAQLKVDPTSEIKHKIAVLTPAELVDTILSEQISRLPLGGRYTAVANPQDWQKGQFSRVFHETKRAAEERGIDVRRMMVLADRGPNKFAVDRDEVRRILNLHFDAASQWKRDTGGGYEFKVLDQYERDRLLRTLKNDAAEMIFSHHFAIVEYSRGDYGLKFEANEPGLSDIEVQGLPSNARELAWLELVWKNLPKLDRDELDRIVARYRDPASSSLWV